jgi:hypothetical protein
LAEPKVGVIDRAVTVTLEISSEFMALDLKKVGCNHGVCKETSSA